MGRSRCLISKNIDARDYEPWNPNALLFNNWIGDDGMEPIILRYKGTAKVGGATTFYLFVVDST